VDVSGSTVKVDTTDELANLYQIVSAFHAFTSNIIIPTRGANKATSNCAPKIGRLRYITYES